MSDLVPIGIRGLDEILFGGVKRGNILLLEGAAGVGKTTLGLEFIYRGVVEQNEPGLVVTFEMSPQKLMRDAKAFGWELGRLEEEGKLRIIYTSPLVLLQELHAHDGLLIQQVRKMKARRLLLDGLSPLRLFGEQFNGRPFRDSLHLLVETLQREDVTAMLTRETPENEGARGGELAHEQFVCDTVLTLRNDFNGRNRARSITISKSRGQDFVPGRHTLRIESGEGVRVYQRAQSRARCVTEQPTSTTRSSIGTAELDGLIGNGVLDGSTTLTVGVSGTGKTVMGLQFLAEGVRQGKPGLLVTLDEHPNQILRNARGLGIPLHRYVKEGKVHMCYESPQELELDVHFDRIARLVEEHKVQRVLIDSLSAYVMAEDRKREFHDFIYALTTFFKDRLLTVFMNYESPELLGVSQISEEIKVSTIVDNIILLNYVEFSNRLRRAITVPKARGSAPSRITREFRITKRGVELEPAMSEDGENVPQLPFSAYYGILARSPARHSPVIDDHLMNGAGASLESVGRQAGEDTALADGPAGKEPANLRRKTSRRIPKGRK